MKPEYIEGPEALENFEQGMRAIFKVPKSAAEPVKKRGKPASSEDKPKKADKD
jgi:hypothetical protein